MENQWVQKRLSAPHPGLLRSRTRLQGEQPLLCPRPAPLVAHRHQFPFHFCGVAAASEPCK